MSTGLIDIMKRASMEAQDSQQPCDLRFGTITSVKPLKVQITNQFILPESLLIVPQHLTDYEVDVTIPNWKTSQYEGHTHAVEGKNKMTVHNSLKVGDQVALIRKTGGQSYYILDRI